MESLEFGVAQFSWYSFVALVHEFTSSTKFNDKRIYLPSETKTDAFTKLHSHENEKKNPQSTKIGPHKIK